MDMEADFAGAPETVSPRRGSLSLRRNLTQRRRSFGSFGPLGEVAVFAVFLGCFGGEKGCFCMEMGSERGRKGLRWSWWEKFFVGRR